MLLHVDGTPTISGIRANFADCLEYSGKLTFGQSNDLKAGSNLAMEQDTVVIYRRAWATSEIFPRRRHVVVDDLEVHALWMDSSGRNIALDDFDATISASSLKIGVTESISFDGWSRSPAVTSVSWNFPESQSTYYFSTTSSFILSSKYTIETWVKPFSTSKDLFW